MNLVCFSFNVPDEFYFVNGDILCALHWQICKKERSGIAYCTRKLMVIYMSIDKIAISLTKA